MTSRLIRSVTLSVGPLVSRWMLRPLRSRESSGDLYEEQLPLWTTFVTPFSVQVIIQVTS